MNKDPGKIEQRREHVRNYVDNYKGKVTKAVENLADSLFLSESTIWKDLKEPIKTDLNA